MAFLIRVFCDNELKSVDLTKIEEFSIGSDETDDIFISANKLNKAQVVFSKHEENFVIKGKHLFDSNGSKISKDILREGNIYYINSNPKVVISVHPKLSDESRVLDLCSVDFLSIGRDYSNDIVLGNVRTSRRHCEIVRKDGIIKMKDLDSSNGVYVNGIRISNEKTILDGDIINISVYFFVYENNSLSFYNIGEDMIISDKLQKFFREKEDLVAKKDKGTISLFGVENETKKKNGTISIFGTEETLKN